MKRAGIHWDKSSVNYSQEGIPCEGALRKNCVLGKQMHFTGRVEGTEQSLTQNTFKLMGRFSASLRPNPKPIEVLD